MLEAAEAWGVPPWEIAERDSKYTWYTRWSSYTNVVNKARRERDEKQAAARKR